MFCHAALDATRNLKLGGSSYGEDVVFVGVCLVFVCVCVSVCVCVCVPEDVASPVRGRRRVSVVGGGECVC